MIEDFINIIQIILYSIFVFCSARRAFYSRKSEWELLTFFFCAIFLGELYWGMVVYFYDRNPVSYISELSWYSAYLFLLLTLISLESREMKKSRRLLAALSFVFTGGMCIFFMKWGDYGSNIISAVLMGLIIWHSLNGLIYIRGKEDQNKRPFYIASFVFCVLEYALWTSSCFWMGDTLLNPYFWFEMMMPLSFLFLYKAFKRAVGE